MKFELDNDEDSKYLIQSYTEDSFTINHECINSNIIISANKLIQNWPPQAIADLAVQHLEEIINQEPEIVLFGTGNHLIFPDPLIISTLTSRQIGVESMDTGAACRCFNLLQNDGRNVVAALLLQGS
jgi:uncharacterized protein